MDSNFLWKLKEDGCMWPLPEESQSRRIAIEVEEQFRKGFLEIANLAHRLEPTAHDPHYDIYHILGYETIPNQRRKINAGMFNKKLFKLEQRGHPGRLAYYRNHLPRLKKWARYKAYLRGKHHALEQIHYGYFKLWFPEDHPLNEWDQFYTEFVRPWVVQVKKWAQSEITEAYICPPSLWETVRAKIDVAKQAEQNDKPGLITIPLSSVEGKEIQWFWPNRIPCSMLSLLVGNPGAGKSFLTMYICSIITTGADWPDAGNTIAPGSVLLFSDEESLEYAIKPRLDDHGADCSKIYAVPHIKREDGLPDTFCIDEHIHMLRQKLEQLPDCRLIIFDPITAYLGAVNANNNAEVRGALIGLQALAQEKKVTILGINHFSKKAELDVIHRILGSTGFVAAARAVWAVFQEKPDDLEEEKDPPRLLIPIKSNYSIAPTTLRFEIKEGQVVFDPQQQRVNIDALMQNAKQAKKSPNLNKAKEFLLGKLEGRTYELARDLIEEAKAEDISKNILYKAKKELGVFDWKDGFGGPVKWSMEKEGDDEASPESDNGNQPIP